MSIKSIKILPSRKENKTKSDSLSPNKKVKLFFFLIS